MLRLFGMKLGRYRSTRAAAKGIGVVPPHGNKVKSTAINRN